jgi:hypothetical protein
MDVSVWSTNEWRISRRLVSCGECFILHNSSLWQPIKDFTRPCVARKSQWIVIYSRRFFRHYSGIFRNVLVTRKGNLSLTIFSHRQMTCRVSGGFEEWAISLITRSRLQLNPYTNRLIEIGIFTSESPNHEHNKSNGIEITKPGISDHAQRLAQHVHSDSVASGMVVGLRSELPRWPPCLQIYAECTFMSTTRMMKFDTAEGIFAWTCSQQKIYIIISWHK